jgi:hypothetical protein
MSSGRSRIAALLSALCAKPRTPARRCRASFAALNLYIRSFSNGCRSVGLVAGTRVFCCDNRGFSGEGRDELPRARAGGGRPHPSGGAPERNPDLRIPWVLEGWERPKYEEFKLRTAWSLYNAFSEILKSRSPRCQMENTLRLSEVFRTGVLP